mmetsp:Transcript_16111/g.27224  ORF Transcript_16111/g.27224 Transcript_16111/m.27224 type:complete len:232 (+) Transcript_16111:1637-2332(+)
MADEIRRVACESLLPYLTQNSSKIGDELKMLTLSVKKKQAEKDLETANKSAEKEQTAATKDLVRRQKQSLIVLEEIEELAKDEHEIFDDYMEMVVTFGYITMFASAFVLGAPIIFVFILVETRSDIFKLERTMKRPIPRKTFHIGSWSLIVEIFCILSIFSNIIICCYASDQIDYLLPWLSEYRDDSATSIVTVFALEHILLFSVFLIKMLRDKNPEWVDIFIARRARKSD